MAAGDPCQLPPLVASPQAVSGSQEGAVSGVASANSGLGRSLFERLVAAGLPTHLLRRQYRCHPDIAAVPNRCFYGAAQLKESLQHGCEDAVEPRVRRLR